MLWRTLAKIRPLIIIQGTVWVQGDRATLAGAICSTTYRKGSSRETTV